MNCVLKRKVFSFVTEQTAFEHQKQRTHVIRASFVYIDQERGIVLCALKVVSCNQVGFIDFDSLNTKLFVTKRTVR